MISISGLRFQVIQACSMVVMVALFYARAHGQGVSEPPIEAFLREGRVSTGAEAMKKLLEANRDDAQARFSLGVAQFFQAVEGLAQDQYRYGLLGGRARTLPMMRLPVPENANPEQISYAKARELVQRFLDRLTIARETLASVDRTSVKLPLRLDQIHLDLNGNGLATVEESLWHITQVLQNPRQNRSSGDPQPFLIVFDGADVTWLQGYCHVLSVVAELVLAYDWQDQFERTAHLFYPKVETPYDFLTAEGSGPFEGFGAQNITDIVAILHTINYAVKEPQRLRNALTHLESVIRLSRESWKLIESETDDDHEWVPNARQTSFAAGIRVGRETIVGWHEFLDEMDDILQGRTLVPFWRGVKGGFGFNGQIAVNPKLGLNVRRMFTEPTRFDLALWVQGTALVPYLEEGSISSPAKWNTMMTAFRGQFFNFALWFN